MHGIGGQLKDQVCRHKDLLWNSQNPRKKLGIAACVCNSSAREAETSGSVELASQPSSKEPLPKNKMDST